MKNVIKYVCQIAPLKIDSAQQPLQASAAVTPFPQQRTKASLRRNEKSVVFLRISASWAAFELSSISHSLTSFGFPAPGSKCASRGSSSASPPAPAWSGPWPSATASSPCRWTRKREWTCFRHFRAYLRDPYVCKELQHLGEESVNRVGRLSWNVPFSDSLEVN